MLWGVMEAGGHVAGIEMEWIPFKEGTWNVLAAISGVSMTKSLTVAVCEFIMHKRIDKEADNYSLMVEKGNLGN